MPYYLNKLIFIINCHQAKGDTQQSHIRKRDTVNGKSEKKDEKEKPKDHDVNERKEKEVKKEIEEKGSDIGKYYLFTIIIIIKSGATSKLYFS